MKKSKLNLLTNRVDYQRMELFFSWIRRMTIALGFIVVIMTICFSFLFFNQNSKIQNLLAQKTVFTNSLNTRQNDQAKLYYLQNKDEQLKKYLSEDANSLPYYNLLNAALSKSTESASLKSFIIQKNRETNFTVAFINFDELVSFFRFIESDEFLKNFENVSLKSFTALGNKTSTTNYELSFAGKFIEIHENSN